jgi:hypothetical protein
VLERLREDVDQRHVLRLAQQQQAVESLTAYVTRSYMH